jgi:hypothetical protein
VQRIPRELLYITLDDLTPRDVPDAGRLALRSLLADLPQVPDATSSAQLIGPPEWTLPCLAVLARHMVQGLRDFNLTLAHDRPRLKAQRGKLLFFDSAALRQRRSEALREAVLCLHQPLPSDLEVLQARHAAQLATFVSSERTIDALSGWRVVCLG